MGKPAKFSEDQVRQIRRDAQPCAHCGRSATHEELAKKWGVSRVMIHFILTRRSYSHVD